VCLVPVWFGHDVITDDTPSGCATAWGFPSNWGDKRSKQGKHDKRRPNCGNRDNLEIRQPVTPVFSFRVSVIFPVLTKIRIYPQILTSH
jgi:hypothetical protein